MNTNRFLLRDYTCIGVQPDGVSVVIADCAKVMKAIITPLSTTLIKGQRLGVQREHATVEGAGWEMPGDRLREQHLDGRDDGVQRGGSHAKVDFPEIRQTGPQIRRLREAHAVLNRVSVCYPPLLSSIRCDKSSHSNINNKMALSKSLFPPPRAFTFR